MSASEDHTIRLWDINKLICLKIYKGHKEGIDLNRLVVLDINRFVSTAHDKTLKLWDFKLENEI